MGRLIKNFQFDNGSYAVRLPVGSGATAPSAPQDGQLRFNAGTNKVEAYYNGSWRELTQAGRVQIVKDSFTTVGVQEDYTMSTSDAATYIAGNAMAVMVFLGGVFQIPEVAYTISSTTLHWLIVPSPGLTMTVLHNLNSTIVA